MCTDFKSHLMRGRCGKVVQEVGRVDMVKYIVIMYEITKALMIKTEKTPNENII